MYVKIVTMRCYLFLLLLPVIAIALPSEMQIIQRLLRGYDKYEPPTRDNPTEVKVGMYIIDAVISGRTEVTVTMYLRQTWRDPRLAFQHISPQPTKIRVNVWDKIWVPDTFFRNDLYSFVHDQTVPNKLATLTREGDIWYVMKLSMKLRMPRIREGDSLLSMMMESFGHTMDTLYFSTLTQPIDVDPDIDLPGNVNIVSADTRDCSQNYTTGAYPCLSFDLQFRVSTPSS